MRKMISTALLVTTTGLTACEPTSVQSEPAEQHRSMSEALSAEQEAPKREAGQKLARALARSLRDPAMRGIVRAAMVQSRVKEGKVHFNSYVRGPGRALLQAMSRQSGMSVAALEELLAQADSLEMYLPVQEHRAAWKGMEDLLVATQYRDHEEPVGFNLAGEPVSLSATQPPATPTLALVPAEDFSADGTPSRRGLALGRDGQSTQDASLVLESGVEQALAENACMPPHRGVFVTSVEIAGDYEGWLMGAPEYEFHLARVQDFRQQLRCAGSGSTGPYHWNMDGTKWTGSFLISWEKDLPTNTGLTMFIYEDDDTECVNKDDKDYPKLTMDRLNASGSEHKAYQVSPDGGGLSVSFSHGVVASRTNLPYGEDEYVGTVTSSSLPIETTEHAFLVKNANQVTTATVHLQYKDTLPTLKSIAVTPTPVSMLPGGQAQLKATGTWSNRATSNLSACATWESSDISYVTVDASGLAQGIQSGGSMVTASYSGKSDTTPVTVKCEDSNPMCGALRVHLKWDQQGENGELYVRTPSDNIIHRGNRGPNAGTDWGQMDGNSIYWPEGFTPNAGDYRICANPVEVPATATVRIFAHGQHVGTLTKTFMSAPTNEDCEQNSQTDLGYYYNPPPPPAQ
jgi:hypothetical protein